MIFVTKIFITSLTTASQYIEETNITRLEILFSFESIFFYYTRKKM